MEITCNCQTHRYRCRLKRSADQFGMALFIFDKQDIINLFNHGLSILNSKEFYNISESFQVYSFIIASCFLTRNPQPATRFLNPSH